MVDSGRFLDFSVGFGDWSDDGHGKLDRHRVRIHSTDGSELTSELIARNYQANVTKLGFGLTHLWEDYEEFNPSVSHLLAFQQELGAVYYAVASEVQVLRDSYSIETLVLDEKRLEALPENGFLLYGSYGDPAIESYSKVPDELRLAMLIVLAGLDSVSWELVPEPQPLFGLGGSLLTGNRSVGYGRFL